MQQAHIEQIAALEREALQLAVVNAMGRAEARVVRTPGRPEERRPSTLRIPAAGAESVRAPSARAARDQQR